MGRKTPGSVNLGIRLDTWVWKEGMTGAAELRRWERSDD